MGKKWLSTYGSYFSDQDNIKSFIKAAKTALPKKKLDILYVASASGLLGEKLIASLGKGNLTIVDISQKHLNENKYSKTKKVKADLLKLNLNKKFNVIMMRSSLDYFPTRALQIKVLKIIANHLKLDGLFINQPAYIPDVKERDLVSKIYNSISKIGRRFFQSTDIVSIYLEAGFGKPTKIGKSKIMRLTEQDHIKRYDLNSKEIQTIQKIIGKRKHSAKVTKNGYTLKFQFPIFAAKLHQPN